MKPFIFILTFILTILLSSYQPRVDKPHDLENDKYLDFVAAVQNRSTFSYFTVIKVKNLNTGVTREICTKGNFVLGALHIELKADYDDKGTQTVLEFAKKHKDRYFEFLNKRALDNISFFDYNSTLVTTIQAKYDFDGAIKTIDRYKTFSISLEDDEMKAFAHVLFNKGYLTGENNCWGGKLEYVDRTKKGQ